MKFKGIIFDVNGTVTDILTDEENYDTYRMMANLLSYQGISILPNELKALYFELNKNQRRKSKEEYPEFDVVKIFHDIIKRGSSDYTHEMSKEKRKLLPEFLAEAYRAATRFKLQLYPGVMDVLASLVEDYQLAALSDGQTLWALPEIHAVGLQGYFHPLIVSSDLGYRKPDPRIFEHALKKMELNKDEVLFVGNDMYRDVYGAGSLGIKTVFFKSNQGDQRNAGIEPDYIIYDFRQLPEAIRFLEERRNY